MMIRNGVQVKFNADKKAQNVIYKLTFPNGKIYIGQTIQTLQRRASQHCTDAIGRSKSFTDVKSRAIRKYKKFTVDVIEVCKDVDELNIREDEIIKEKESKGIELYNTASGGLNNCAYFGVACVLLDKDLNVIQEFDKVKDATEYIGKWFETSISGKFNLIDGKYYVMHKDEYELFGLEEIIEQKDLFYKKREERKRNTYNVVKLDHRHNVVEVLDIATACLLYGEGIKNRVGEARSLRTIDSYWIREEHYNNLIENDIPLETELNGLDYIYKINIKGEIEAEFPTVKEAAKDFGCRAKRIVENLKFHTICSHKFFYMLSSEYYNTIVDDKYIKMRTRRKAADGKPIKVQEYDEKGVVVEVYGSIKECATLIGADLSTLSKSLGRGQCTYKGHILEKKSF